VLPWSAVGPEGEDRLGKAAVSVRCLQRADGSLADNAEESDLIAMCARAY
jgi:prolyl-tRNA synthetase